MLRFLLLLAFCLLTQTSHIDDEDNLMELKHDKVVFRLKKDCSLDRMPGVNEFFKEEAQKYPKMDTYLLDEGEPRLEVYYKDKLVDKIKIYRHDIYAIRRILEDLKVERDENYTWEKRQAIYELEMAFKDTAKYLGFSKSERE